MQHVPPSASWRWTCVPLTHGRHGTTCCGVEALGAARVSVDCASRDGATHLVAAICEQRRRGRLHRPLVVARDRPAELLALASTWPLDRRMHRRTSCASCSRVFTRWRHAALVVVVGEHAERFAACVRAYASAGNEC
eukprot:4532098-Pleurochrysis_carterae.AAC.5